MIVAFEGAVGGTAFEAPHFIQFAELLGYLFEFLYYFLLFFSFLLYYELI